VPDVSGTLRRQSEVVAVKSLSDLCEVERQKVVTHGTLDLATGQHTIRSTETVIEQCGTPLFSEQERQSGVCHSCREGWSVEGNQPTERGLQTIQGART
jgi:hypothetical protein